VIGETAIVGDRVHLHQGVTPGGDPTHRVLHDPDGVPNRRHPDHEGPDVIILAGGTVMGPVTIGAGSVFEGNVWLSQDVPAVTLVAAPPPAFHPRT
jgi:serine O-acetyltransferase